MTQIHRSIAVNIQLKLVSMMCITGLSPKVEVKCPMAKLSTCKWKVVQLSFLEKQSLFSIGLNTDLVVDWT